MHSPKISPKGNTRKNITQVKKENSTKPLYLPSSQLAPGHCLFNITTFCPFNRTTILTCSAFFYMFITKEVFHNTIGLIKCLCSLSAFYHSTLCFARFILFSCMNSINEYTTMFSHSARGNVACFEVLAHGINLEHIIVLAIASLKFPSVPPFTSMISQVSFIMLIVLPCFSLTSLPHHPPQEISVFFRYLSLFLIAPIITRQPLLPQLWPPTTLPGYFS